MPTIKDKPKIKMQVLNLKLDSKIESNADKKIILDNSFFSSHIFDTRGHI